MPTGYDLLEHSHEFRMHMLRRLAAGLIDVSLIFIPVGLLVFIFDVEPKELLVGVISGFGWFLYSTVAEWKKGATIGKTLVGHVVVSIEEPMTLSKAVVRNVPKMFWYVFLPIDFFIGLGFNIDPRQRWVDTISKTTVVKKIKK